MEVYCPHLSMVVQQVMISKIISQVLHDWFPEDMEMVLFGSILNPIKAHIHGFWSFLAHFIVYIPFLATDRKSVV